MISSNLKKKFAILGYPLTHTLSPVMHTTAFRLLDLPHSFEAISVHPSKLEEKYRTLLAQGYVGFNITIPYKSLILQFIDSFDETARAAGAVNTIVIENGKTRGYNTDVHGFVASIIDLRKYIDGNRVLLIGTGGAARAVAVGLLKDFHPREVTIAGRNRENIDLFLKHLNSSNNHIIHQSEVRGLALTEESFFQDFNSSSVVINATPVGMYPNSHDTPLPAGVSFHGSQLAVDLIYIPKRTRFLKDASGAGARTLGGLEMLLQQGASAFQLFTGHAMPLDPVREALKKELHRETE